MNFKLKILAAVVAALTVLHGCTVKYSFSGASIPIEAQTYSVAYFPNNAPLVAPLLSTTFTDALQDKFARQTRLSQTREDGDLSMEGEIIGYTSTPASISGDEVAVQNRLTIAVRVRFQNRFEPENNFERTFSQFSDYPASNLLQDEEEGLINVIVEMLVDDIFNAAVANW